MSLKSLFLIILKVLALFFLRDFLSSIPAFLSLISVLSSLSASDAVSPILGGLFIIGVFGYVTYVLLFRTEWVIEKLQLTRGFEEQTLSFHIHRSTVLSITVIVVGALMIINALPGALRNAFLLFQENRNGLLGPIVKADRTMLILCIAEIVVGLLLLGNVRVVVSYIDLKRRDARLHNVPKEDTEGIDSQSATPS